MEQVVHYAVRRLVAGGTGHPAHLRVLLLLGRSPPLLPLNFQLMQYLLLSVLAHDRCHGDISIRL